MEWIDAQTAKQLILSGQAPAGMHVKGHLDFTASEQLRTLPVDLDAQRLTLDSAPYLEALPDGLRCYELSAQQSRFTMIPSDITVEYRLNLSNSRYLTHLPTGLKVGSLVLRGCTAMTSLPDGLDVYFLDIAGCTNLVALPEQATIRIGNLIARGCTRLRALPTWLTNLSQLDVCDCTSLCELPEGLRVGSWADIAHTQITTLPQSMKGTRLRWRDVLVDERIVFHPETITVQEILDETNAEMRRVLLDRKGNAAFIKEAHGEVLYQDTDPGGERRLLRVPLTSDEPLVCLEVRCPSTARQYLLRVPPTMQTCHQAAAWIAGFDNPDDYRPLVET